MSRVFRSLRSGKVNLPTLIVEALAHLGHASVCTLLTPFDKLRTNG